MRYFPVFFDLHDKACLIVGGGEVAARKAALLLRAGARITVVAPQLSERLQRRLNAGDIEHRARAFQPGDLDGHDLVIAATGNRVLNAEVSKLSKARRLPVNVVDQPDLCSFIMPSIVDRSPVQIAVSSGGASPVLARLLRSRLETMIPAGYGKLAELLKEFRETAKQHIADPDRRRDFWEQVVEGPIAEMMFAGKDDDARAALRHAIDKAREDVVERGEVYLVGAGPGDPDLLTFRALRLLQQADVVVHDRLVSQAILDLARRDADLIYVGKERDRHTLPQEDINQLLVRLAKQGKRVLRLKGGDPFIFGRGGEEIATLMQEGVAFQIVPGITAASGAASYAGIPLTHRDYAQAVSFVTGVLKDGKTNLNWAALAQPQQTVVVYMGLHGVRSICEQLIAHGQSENLPIALVQQATTPQQRVLVGTLKTMPDLVEQSDVKAPTLLIIGEVVKLHKQLAWFQPPQS